MNILVTHLCLAESLITGDKNFEQVAALNYLTIEMSHGPCFKLYEQHSDVLVLKGKELEEETDQIFATQQLGMKLNEALILDFIGFYRY